MNTEIELGKVDFLGRKNCPVTIQLELEEKGYQRNLEFSASGYIESANKKGVYASGQILDEPALEGLTGDAKELFLIIKDLWKKWHLNTMRAGTKAQMEVIKNLDLGAARDYDECCKVLKEKGLYEAELSDEEKKVNPGYADKPYRFGSGWLTEKIPDNDIDKIKCIIDTYIDTHNINYTLDAVNELCHQDDLTKDDEPER